MSISVSLKTVYHVRDGAVPMMAAEAVRVVRDFPDEWRATPWADAKKAPTTNEKEAGKR